MNEVMLQALAARLQVDTKRKAKGHTWRLKALITQL